jgi:hypothetical protein
MGKIGKRHANLGSISSTFYSKLLHVQSKMTVKLSKNAFWIYKRKSCTKNVDEIDTMWALVALDFDLGLKRKSMRKFHL